MRFLESMAFVVLATSCSHGGIQLTPVYEIPFGDSPDSCARLHYVSRAGKDPQEARTRIREAVLEAGGNAVVFVDAVIRTDPASAAIAYAENAVICKCDEPMDLPKFLVPRSRTPR